VKIPDNQEEKVISGQMIAAYGDDIEVVIPPCSTAVPSGTFYRSTQLIGRHNVITIWK
jgi:hypothetical protein